MNWVFYSLLAGAAICYALGIYKGSEKRAAEDARIDRLRAKRDWDVSEDLT